MPTAIAPITNFLYELGLRAPLGRKKGRYDSNPAVRELYESHIGKLCDTHATKPFASIATCPDLRSSANDLLRVFGHKIWGNQAHRPWLLDPGDGANGAEYVKHLYFDDDEDHEFLEKKLHALIVAKTQRQRKHGRSSMPVRDTSSDPSWTPAPIGRPVIPVHINSSICFGPHLEDLSATSLEKRGIWLGHYEDDDIAINGRSLNEVGKDYSDATIVGGYTSGVEPHGLFEKVPEVTAIEAECAACKSVSKGTGGRLKIRVLGFVREDSDGQLRMTKHFWALLCMRKKECLYAILKELPEKQCSRFGLKGRTWCFWKVDGGYTNSTFLVTEVPKDETIQILIRESDADSHRSDRGRKRKDHLTSSPADDVASTMPVRKRSKATCDRPDEPTETVVSAFQPINQSTSALADSEQTQRPPNGPPLAQDLDRERERSHDSLYDTTPAPRPPEPAPQSERDSHVNGLRPARFFQTYTAPPAADSNDTDDHATVEQLPSDLPDNTTTVPQPDTKPEREPTPRAISAPANVNGSMDPPTFSLRFRVWFKLEWAKGRNVVMLDDSMTVQDVFTRVQQILRRKLEGKSLVALSVRFEADEEDYTDIEIDDSGCWETILELVKERGKTELFGTVEVE